MTPCPIRRRAMPGKADRPSGCVAFCANDGPTSLSSFCSKATTRTLQKEKYANLVPPEGPQRDYCLSRLTKEESFPAAAAANHLVGRWHPRLNVPRAKAEVASKAEQSRTDALGCADQPTQSPKQAVKERSPIIRGSPASFLPSGRRIRVPPPARPRPMCICRLWKDGATGVL